MRSESVLLGMRDLVAALLLVGAVLAFGWARMVPGVVGAFHDDGVYALTAKALAEGEGYRLIQLPGAPPQTKYPVLYPALLSLLWDDAAPLAARIREMQFATMLLAAAAVAGFYLYLVRFGYAGRVAALGGAAIATSAPNFLYYATSLLSELPFALALVAALFVADRELRSVRASPLHELSVGLAVAMPFLVRSAGVVVAPAVLAVLALHRKRIGWTALGAALAMAPWIAWSALMRGSATGDAIASYQTDYLAWCLGVWRSVGPGYALVNAGKTLAAVTHIAFEAAARGLYAATDHAATIARLLGATSFVWLALELRRRSLVGLVVTSYVVFVCFWPWAPDRFVVPLLPLLAIAALTMLERALARVASHAIATGAIVALATSIVASNASLLASYSKQSGASGYPYFMPPAEPVTWASYEDAFTWLRENSDPDDVVVAGFDTMTALYTERRAVRPFVPRPDALFYGADSSPVGGVDDLAEVLASYRPRYLFLSPMPAFPEEEPLYQLVEHYVAARPGALTRAYVGSDPRFLVYEVNVRR